MALADGAFGAARRLLRPSSTAPRALRWTDSVGIRFDRPSGMMITGQGVARQRPNGQSGKLRVKHLRGSTAAPTPPESRAIRTRTADLHGH
jgi:hypothetical protein